MKRLLPVLLFFSLPILAGAQQYDSIRFGLIGGPSFAYSTGEVQGPSVTGGAFTVGGILGGSAELVAIPYMSIEVDILYSLTTYGVEVNNTDKATILHSALEIPVMAKGRIPVDSGAFFLGAGVDLIFILGQIRFKDSSSNAATQIPPRQLFHTAFVASGGFDWILDSGSNLKLDLRYHRTFSSPIAETDLRANRFDVLVGWSVNL